MVCVIQYQPIKSIEMTTKPFILAGFAMLFILASCSSDDAPTATIPTNLNPVFDQFTVEHRYIQGDNTEQTTKFTTHNLQDEKFFAETSEDFVNGVGQGEVTAQRYFYENNLLVKRAYENDERDFFYDAQGRLIAINWLYENTQHSYYRFVHVAVDKVYFERLSLAYDNPATTVMSRIIVDFDANDNIVKAGNDLGLDGTTDNYNTFDYDAANNLKTIHKSDGSTINIAYSLVKDNFAKLAVNTYGKRNLMIYQAESYATSRLQDLRQSPNLRDTDTQDALIETLALPYYFRKTQTIGSLKTITTFYFD